MDQVDARGVARVAQNPACRRQTAMILLGLPDWRCRELFAAPRHISGGIGERATALRWGAVFDRRLAEGGGARLLASLTGQAGLRPETASVRDLREEIPGRSASVMEERSRRLRAVLADLLAGKIVPDVLIQPPLKLVRGDQDWGAIVPDALVLDRSRLAYVPLEAKGCVSVDGIVPVADRGRMRLQAAVQVHALRAEFARLGQAGLVTPRAFLVVASPYGFRPAPAVLEELEAEVETVGSALQSLEEVRTALGTQPRGQSRSQILARTPPSFREACLLGCGLADVCRREGAGTRGALGARTVDIMGPEPNLARVAALLAGSPPAGAADEAALDLLQDAAALFGWGR